MALYRPFQSILTCFFNRSFIFDNNKYKPAKNTSEHSHHIDMPKRKTIPQQHWSPEELALLHYIHSLRSREYPHGFSREIINLNTGYGSRIIDDTTKPPPIAETENRAKIRDFEVLAQELDRRISPPTSKNPDHLTLWARVQINGEYGPCFDIIENYDVHLWTIHGGSDLEYKDDVSAKRNLKPKDVMENAKEESRIISKYVWEPRSVYKAKNDVVTGTESKPEDESKYRVDEKYIVDERFKDNWRRKEDSKPTAPLKPEVRNKWNPKDTAEYKDDSKYQNDFRNRPDSIRRVDSKFTERSWRVGVVKPSEKPVEVFPIFCGMNL